MGTLGGWGNYRATLSPPSWGLKELFIPYKTQGRKEQGTKDAGVIENGKRNIFYSSRSDILHESYQKNNFLSWDSYKVICLQYSGLGFFFLHIYLDLNFFHEIFNTITVLQKS